MKARVPKKDLHDQILTTRTAVDKFVQERLDNELSYFDLIMLMTLKSEFDFSPEQLLEYIESFKKKSEDYKLTYDEIAEGTALTALAVNLRSLHPELDKFLDLYYYHDTKLE